MKKKKMHKWLSLFLAVVMVLTIVPVTVHATEGLEPDVANGIFYRDAGSDVLDLGLQAGYSTNKNVVASHVWQYDGDLYVALHIQKSGEDNHKGDLIINGILIPESEYMQLPEGKSFQVKDENDPENADLTYTGNPPKNYYWRIVKVMKQGNLITLTYDTNGTDNGWKIPLLVYEIQGALTVNHHYAGIETAEIDMFQSQNPIGGIQPGIHPIRSQKAPDASDERDDFYKDGYQLSYVTVTRKDQEPVRYGINALKQDAENGSIYWLDLVTDEADRGSSVTVDFYYDAPYYIAHIQNGVNEYTENFLWTYDDYAAKFTEDLTKHVTGANAETDEEKNTEHFFTGDSGDKQIGFLYGGMYAAPDEDGKFDTLLTVDAEVDALAVTPEAGKTYYIKEVPETYLVPKLISMQRWQQVKGAYMLTAIDDYNDYLEAGFDFTVEGLPEQQTVEQLTAYTLIDGILLEGKPHKYFKVGVNSDNEGYDTAAPVFTDLYFAGNDKAAATVGDFVCSPFANGDEDSVNFVRERRRDDKATTFIPYFVTLDGLKVTGVSNRTFKFEDGNPIATPVGDPGHVGSTITRVKSAPVAPMMLRSTFLMALNAETADEFTITKICGDITEEQVITAGDWTNKVSYVNVESQLFAGWYEDAELTVPADFSNVQSDMTVYAKYISDNYLTITVNQQKKDEKTLIAAVDAAAYVEYGFVYGEKFVSLSGVKKVGGNTAQKLFGVDGVLICDTVLVKNLTEGVGAVAPYAVTADGTLVYGTTLEMEGK